MVVEAVALCGMDVRLLALCCWMLCNVAVGVQSTHYNTVLPYQMKASYNTTKDNLCK